MIASLTCRTGNDTGTSCPATGRHPSRIDPHEAGLVAFLLALEDRNGTLLDNPPAPRLAEGQATSAYLDKRARDLPVAARSKAGFKSMGFWYTDFSTKITVESVDVTGSTASVHFKELTEEHQASAANGPSNVPSGYPVPQTASFRASAKGWQRWTASPRPFMGTACLCPSSRTEDGSANPSV